MLHLIVASAFAGAWTQAEGEGYAKMGYRVVLGTGGFDADGKHTELGPYQDHAAQVYAEYGLSDGWTAVLSSTPFGHVSLNDTSSAYVGPTRLGVRRALSTGSVKTAVELQGGATRPASGPPTCPGTPATPGRAACRTARPAASCSWATAGAATG